MPLCKAYCSRPFHRHYPVYQTLQHLSNFRVGFSLPVFSLCYLLLTRFSRLSL